jgi:hypothetical protein
MSKTTGKETAAYAAFSGTFWKGTTNNFLESINECIDTEDMINMKLIIDKAMNAAKRPRRTENSSVMTHDNKEPKVMIHNGADTSESESEN